MVVVVGEFIGPGVAGAALPEGSEPEDVVDPGLNEADPVDDDVTVGVLFGKLNGLPLVVVVLVLSAGLGY